MKRRPCPPPGLSCCVRQCLFVTPKKTALAAHFLKTTTTTKPKQNKNHKTPRTPPLLENVFRVSPFSHPVILLCQTVTKGRTRYRNRRVREAAWEGRMPALWIQWMWERGGFLGLLFSGPRRVRQSNYSNQTAPGRGHHLPPALRPCYSLRLCLSCRGGAP